MKAIPISMLMLISLTVPSWAADDTIKFPLSFEKLGERATESVDVTLDASMLRLASGFLSQDDPDEAHVKKIVTKLKGVYVRSFEFDKDGQYSMTDVEALRSQFRGPEWSRIVGVKSNKGENTDIFLKKNGDAVSGLIVIATEPRELTVVHIDGSINPEDLTQLSGHLGIPRIGKGDAKKNSGKEED